MAAPEESRGVKRKLHGREFYRSIGSPKYILAPMVDQSEFAWRMLTRSFMPAHAQSSLLAYTPMLHSRLFTENPKYRQSHFRPLHTPLPSPPDAYHASQLPPTSHALDGNPSFDRPLFVQFCANDPSEFLSAAQHVAPYCDAVDLNLGCPQGIARKGRYGAFLQEDWPTISSLISTLHRELDVPVTAKFRIQESKERTLEYARMILDAGASVITVHGRRREQKGHNTGLADWSMIRYLREQLPPDTVIFANGNVLLHGDIEECLQATGADGVMSAEGNLYDPSIFAEAPEEGEDGREYWRGKDGRSGWRMDAVMRRYMDIIHRHVLGSEPPERRPLWVPDDGELPALETKANGHAEAAGERSAGPPEKKKQKRKEKANSGQKPEKESDVNLTAMQAHLFHMLRSLVARYTNIRDALARTRAGDIDGFERILSMVEMAVAEGIRDAALSPSNDAQTSIAANGQQTEVEEMQQGVKELDPHLSSVAAVERCRKPWFICQPYVRPLPQEALEKGALSISKKERKRQEAQKEEAENAGVSAEGKVEAVNADDGRGKKRKLDEADLAVTREEQPEEKVEIPREGLVCG